MSTKENYMNNENSTSNKTNDTIHHKTNNSSNNILDHNDSKYESHTAHSNDGLCIVNPFIKPMFPTLTIDSYSSQDNDTACATIKVQHQNSRPYDNTPESTVTDVSQVWALEDGFSGTPSGSSSESAKSMVIECNLNELKLVDNNTKYTVFGYIRSYETMDIPELICWLILHYYRYYIPYGGDEPTLTKTPILQAIEVWEPWHYWPDTSICGRIINYGPYNNKPGYKHVNNHSNCESWSEYDNTQTDSNESEYVTLEGFMTSSRSSSGGSMVIECNLNELKSVDNNTKYTVFGYIRNYETLLKHNSKNAHFGLDIPELVCWLIIHYYRYYIKPESSCVSLHSYS